MESNRQWHEEARLHIADKVARTSLRIRDGFPHASVDGEYKLEPYRRV